MESPHPDKRKPKLLSPVLQDRQIDRITLGWIAVALLAFLIVDVLTRIYEFQRANQTVPLERILLLEVTGVGAYLGMAWFIGRLVALVPPDQARWTIFLPFHVAGSLGTALGAVCIFVGARKVISAHFLNETYIFDAYPLGGFFYEYRKFALYYAAALVLFALRRQLSYREVEAEAATDEARASHRITVKDNSRTLLIDATEVLWMKSASNYVDIGSKARTLLVRSTLRDLGDQLTAAGIPALRVHRSYIVNGHHILSCHPDGEGGLCILLSEGTKIPCSRRYRGNVERYLSS